MVNYGSAMEDLSLKVRETSTLNLTQSNSVQIETLCSLFEHGGNWSEKVNHMVLLATLIDQVEYQEDHMALFLTLKVRISVSLITSYL